MLIDTHAHLDMLEAPLGEVMARAREAGVGGIVTVGESLASSRLAAELAGRYDGSDGTPEVWAAVGVHPHEARHFDSAASDELRRLAAEPRVVAIGEIGLDFHYDLSPRDAQREAFAAQLALAGELGLPVIVHSREAADEIFAAVEGFIVGSAAAQAGRAEPARKVLIHCFTGDRDEAVRLTDIGCRIAVGGVITFRSADRLREAVLAVPRDRLMLETDSPYLAPVPRRGERNEPANVALVAEALAELRGTDSAAAASETTRAATEFFGIAPRAAAADGPGS